MRDRSNKLSAEKNRVAFLFPGISVDYHEALEKLQENEIFRQHCQSAGIHHGNIRTQLEGKNKAPEDHELLKQILLYTICCTIADLYTNQNILPILVSGYSMGIYAAFYVAKAYTFETGLAVLKEAFFLTRKVYTANNQNFAMGGILGLSESNIREIFTELGGELYIASFNGAHSFVITGERKPLLICLKKAEKWGAFRTIQFDTVFGYHAPQLREISLDFRQFLSSCHISSSQYKYLSPITGKLLTEPDEIIHEIIENMHSPIRWTTFINRLFHVHHISVCHEIGPGDSLKKMTRYINRKIRVYPFSHMNGGGP